MKIIITGITGFVGSHLADFLINDCPEVEVHGSNVTTYLVLIT